MDKGFKRRCCLFPRKVVPVLLGLPGGVSHSSLGLWMSGHLGKPNWYPSACSASRQDNNQVNKSSGAASLWLFSYPVERDRCDPEAVVTDLNTGHGIRNSTTQVQGESSLKGCKISCMASLEEVCSQEPQEEATCCNETLSDLQKDALRSAPFSAMDSYRAIS